MVTQHRPRGESGTTLIEMLVAMGIFTIVVTVFMGGLVGMTQSTARSQSVSDSADAVRKAFQRMDKQVRYASAINRPGAGASGARYVEFRTTAVPAGKSPFCTQWRYDPTTAQLQVRTWDDVPSAPVSAWSTIVTSARNDLTLTDNLPFAFTPADATYTRQSLTVTLDVGYGTQAGSQMSSTFVARNSSSESLSNTDSEPDGDSDTPVCTLSSSRP